MIKKYEFIEIAGKINGELRPLLHGIANSEVFLDDINDDLFHDTVRKFVEILRMPENVAMTSGEILGVVTFRRDFLNSLFERHPLYRKAMAGVIFLNQDYPSYSAPEFQDQGCTVPDSVVLGTALLEFIGA